jgi:hypothetical protein
MAEYDLTTAERSALILLAIGIPPREEDFTEDQIKKINDAFAANAEKELLDHAKQEFITVVLRGRPIAVHREIAETLCLEEGQHISREIFTMILELHLTLAQRRLKEEQEAKAKPQ